MPTGAPSDGAPSDGDQEDVAALQAAVSTDCLIRFAETFADLADPEVITRAWR